MLSHIHSVNKLMLVFAAIAILVLLLSGCNKDESLAPIVTEDDYTEEVAASVANLCSEYNGGIIDNAGDIFALSGDSGSLDKALDSEFNNTKTASYDSLSKIWTVVVAKSWVSPDGKTTANFTRTYSYQFLNKNGAPQKHWRVEDDTAYSIVFHILSGSGSSKGPKITHQLNAIQGSWTATNTNSDIITINGSYQRSAIDSIFHEDGTRISDHNVNMNLVNVTGPRGSRRDLSQKISGTLNGIYEADITIIRPNVTIEKEVEKQITITINNGELNINVDITRYNASATTGDVTS